MMNTIFCDLINEGNVTVYMDDIAIHMGPRKGETHEEHVAQHQELVQQVLERLKTNNLHLNLEKCIMLQVGC